MARTKAGGLSTVWAMESTEASVVLWVRGIAMAPKKSTKKATSPREQSAKKARTTQRQPASVELGSNEIKIKFDHPHQVLPKLLELAHYFSEAQVDALAETSLPATAVAAAGDVLGGARARIIVSSCTHSTAFLATLADLGLNPLIFRNCVALGVNNAGFVPPSNIPATPDTRLIDVVATIQGAPRKP
jgi:hypothetical protein